MTMTTTVTATSVSGSSSVGSGTSHRKQVSRSLVVGSGEQQHESNGNGVVGTSCFSCGRTIRERYLLRALDQYWHEDCLKCSCCDCRLGEVGSTLFAKANLILCKRDYLRLFGNTANCSACNKTIPGFEMVMRARSNVYHLECFSCFECHQKFCVGDRFYLHENKILCEYDYEEMMAFGSVLMQGAMTTQANNNNNNHHHNNNCLVGNGQMAAQGLGEGTVRRLSKDGLSTGNEVGDAASSGYGSADSPFA